MSMEMRNQTEGTPDKDLVGLCQRDMQSFGLSHEDAQDKDQWNQWGTGLRGHLENVRGNGICVSSMM